MKITYRIHPAIEQQIEISKLSEHLQKRIYDFINSNKFISKEDDLISMSDMLDLQGTVSAIIDKYGNINCIGCNNCSNCTECSDCENCRECSN